MKRPTQPELPELADFRVEVCFVDEVTQATERLRADGFQVVGWTWVVGKGQYVLNATRVNRPGPDLDVQPRHHESAI